MTGDGVAVTAEEARAAREECERGHCFPVEELVAEARTGVPAKTVAELWAGSGI